MFRTFSERAFPGWLNLAFNVRCCAIRVRESKNLRTGSIGFAAVLLHPICLACEFVMNKMDMEFFL
ncbi:hypothetical protein CPB83DRAFT_226174 [Crepidotus variabilis]|uniref:Uncharacterized protein n=1 Tax=Crepidotus variabilis TaxID=179855 RepID=A0A9P6ETL5_9AGAR|nr:hypothetical protein CPB83DRAFT_226174 [Crepidotus variabilis]